MSNSVIFHLPMELDPNRASASHLRPARMIEAFETLGYDVVRVVGNARRRREVIRTIRRDHRFGRQFAFVYSESSTMPTLLTERHHLPTAPFLDFGFLAWCRRQRIPVGLFYRDVYWRLPEYRDEVILPKRSVARLFYRLDLLAYRRTVDLLYVPSEGMLEFSMLKRLPPVRPLPPGCSTSYLPPKQTAGGNPHDLHLLFVGGVNAHVRLEALLRAVGRRDGVHLTLCVRADDWGREKGRYQSILGKHITIIHAAGDELNELYRFSDIGLLFSADTAFRRIAMPMKLFEYLSHGMPIIATRNSAAGRFVREHDVGWTVASTEEALVELLDRIMANPAELQAKSAAALALARTSTWTDRARTVAADLAGVRS
jgi:glycosyltransferase involved in cell wall biosynthesis